MVSWYKRDQKWMALIRLDGKCKRSGLLPGRGDVLDDRCWLAALADVDATLSQEEAAKAWDTERVRTAHTNRAAGRGGAGRG